MNLFQIKPKIYYGPNALNVLKQISSKRVMLVTDENMVKLKLADRVLSVLNAGTDSIIFSDVKPDPALSEIIKGIKVIDDFKPDCMIALGGGSPIDACKAMVYFYGKMQATEKKPLFIAIPTTSGTGSEVTNYSVITADGHKIVLTDEYMLPDKAVLEPSFVRTLPPAIIADTGMDVLTHALEAYVSDKVSLCTSSLALGAVKAVFDNLYNHYKDNTNTEASLNMQLASCIAGMAFGNASLGINHAIAHALGAKYHVPHGRANAMVLPNVILFNSKSPKASTAYDNIARLIKLPVYRDGSGAQQLAKAIDAKKKKMNMVMSVRDLKISKEQYFSDLDYLADLILKDSTIEFNPRKFSRSELLDLLKSLY